MKIYDFRVSSCGKTYYEINISWRDLKKRIKSILDDKEHCRLDKLNLIISLCETYKDLYYISKNEVKK